MRFALRDLGTWLPLVLATVVLTLRERSRVPPLPAADTATAIELPALRTGAAPTRVTSYELDRAHSSVRFQLDSGGNRTLFTCEIASGRFVAAADDTQNRLSLRLDLASLRPTQHSDAGLALGALRDLLGVHRGGDVSFTGELVSRASTPVPALQQLIWQGTLRFGGRSIRQEMALWQTALPGRPLRLQGHGAVRPDTYGITRSAWFGLWPEQHVVTLGLDLAWKRAPVR